jgi:DNA end-binding protein Ku
MHSLWTGTISFGLVNIPVQLYSAVDEQKLDLDMLHKKDLSPVRFARVCRSDGHEIPYNEIVKGYEFRKGDYVVLEEEDFKKANARKTNTIDILQFAEESDIDPVYYDKPYYLEPGKGGDNAYALLRDALERSRRVGIARFAMRNREHLAAVKPAGNAILLHTLRFKSEVRTPKLRVPGPKTARGREMDMALQLINQLTEKFHPEIHKDTYIEELKNVIETKAKGRAPAAKEKEPAPTRVTDLMETLKASLHRTREREREKVSA